MGAYEALLIGVDARPYGEGFEDLAAVPDDLDRMEEALTHRGYTCGRPSSDTIRDPTKLQDAIGAFCKACRPGETRVIYFTGHGVNYEGQDRLVPAGVSRGEASAGLKLVRIDDEALLNDPHGARQETGHILFIIDACREEGDSGTRGGAKWGGQGAETRLVRMHGCKSGKRCWTNKAGHSVFSAALVAALTKEGSAELTDVLERTQLWCRELADSEDRVQSPRLDPESVDEVVASHEFFPLDRKRASIEMGDDGQLWVVVLQSESAGPLLADTVSSSLEKSRKEIERQAGLPLDANLRVIDINEALESPERWLELVEALCKAPAVVADATRFEPGVMLSLGIRAVVRRGVTLTALANPVEEEEELEHTALPFNIQELKLIGAETRDTHHPQHPLRLIGAALADGLRQQRLNPTYQDLPGFHAVRCIEPPAKVQHTVLVLCPFRDKAPWKYLSNWFSPRSGKLITGSRAPDVVRMLDMESSRLVGPALYEQLRWSQACIVDWTAWRANVFFEFGVRLACSKLAPVIVIMEQQEQEALERGSLRQQQQLLELFRPTPYDPKDRKGERIKEALERHRQVLSDEYEPAAGEIAPNLTHKRITEWYFWQQEPSILSPDEDLRLLIESQMGKDPQSSGSAPAIFSDNREYLKALRRCTEERWIARWRYLRNRYSDKVLATKPDLQKKLATMGEDIRQWLPRRKYRDMYEEITEFIKEFPDASSMNGEERES